MFAAVVYGSEDQWVEDKLKGTLDDIDELYKKLPMVSWARQGVANFQWR